MVAVIARDAAATRRRIIDAAAEEFAARGRAGARIDEIAARARANKRLIYSYVGDKDALYDLVLTEQLARFGVETTLDPDDVPGFVGDLYDFFAGDPVLARLFMWEALECGDEGVPDEVVRNKRVQEKIAAIELAQRRGHVDPTFDAAHLLVTLIGLAAWWFAAPQLARMATGSPKAGDGRRRDHAVDAARRLVAPRDA